jgi:hypothetical protein
MERRGRQGEAWEAGRGMGGRERPGEKALKRKPWREREKALERESPGERALQS